MSVYFRDPDGSLLEVAVGPAGCSVAALAAVLLTFGTTNAYLTGACPWPGR